jgi:hypothetical protein
VAASSRPYGSDITELILADHRTFRDSFARLDDLSGRNDPGELAAVWRPLADLLDVHAVAEEEIFYPHLLREAPDAREDTLDAIGDHNDIRDAIRAAAAEETGSEAWWAAVRAAREANDEHLAEEERDPLPDFRAHAPSRLRRTLGRRFLEFKRAHPTSGDVDTGDRDPESYVRSYDPEETGTRPAPAEGSLAIGSLRGR